MMALLIRLWAYMKLYRVNLGACHVKTQVFINVGISSGSPVGLAILILDNALKYPDPSSSCHLSITLLLSLSCGLSPAWVTPSSEYPSMKSQQWVIRGTHGIESLFLEDVNVPDPGDYEIQIKLHAASLNFRDLKVADVSKGPKLDITYIFLNFSDCGAVAP